jgi:hypothetical protein
MHQKRVSTSIDPKQREQIQKLTQLFTIGKPGAVLVERAIDLALGLWKLGPSPAADVVQFSGEILARITKELLLDATIGGKARLLLERWSDFVLQDPQQTPPYQRVLTPLMGPVQSNIETICHSLLSRKSDNPIHVALVAMILNFFPAPSFPYQPIHIYLNSSQPNRSDSALDKECTEIIVAGIISSPQELHYPGYFFTTMLHFIEGLFYDHKGLLAQTFVADESRWPDATQFKLTANILEGLIKSLPREQTLKQLVIQLLTRYWTPALREELIQSPGLMTDITQLVGRHENDPEAQLKRLTLAALVVRFLPPTPYRAKQKITTLTRLLLKELPKLAPSQRRPLEIIAAEGLIHRRPNDLDTVTHTPQPNSVLSWCIQRNIRPANVPPIAAHLEELLDTMCTESLPESLFIPLISDTMDANLTISASEGTHLVTQLDHPNAQLRLQATQCINSQLGILSPFLTPDQFKAGLDAMTSPNDQVTQLIKMFQHCVTAKSETLIATLTAPIDADWIKSVVQAPDTVCGQLLRHAMDCTDPDQETLLSLPGFEHYSDLAFKALSELKEWHRYPLAQQVFQSAITHWIATHSDDPTLTLLQAIMPALVNHDGFLFSDESTLKPLFPEAIWADFMPK